MLSKATILALASSGIGAVHINRGHLQLKLQALKEETHCMVEHAILDGDVYPKRLCIRQKYESNDPIIEDNYESNPEWAHRVWSKNPNEKYNDCFCEEGYTELASTGECIKSEDCAVEYRENCSEGEEYGLYISEEPYCRAKLDLNELKNNPDIFDDLMESVLGSGGVQMNWLEIFSPSQLNSIFDDACNEIDSPIKRHCEWSLNSSGFANVYNSIGSLHQFQVRKLVLKSSFLSGSMDDTTLKRGCHCKQGYGRMRDATQKYIRHGGDICYNQCVKEEECGADFTCNEDQ